MFASDPSESCCEERDPAELAVGPRLAKPRALPVVLAVEAPVDGCDLELTAAEHAAGIGAVAGCCCKPAARAVKAVA